MPRFLLDSRVPSRRGEEKKTGDCFVACMHLGSLLGKGNGNKGCVRAFARTCLQRVEMTPPISRSRLKVLQGNGTTGGIVWDGRTAAGCLWAKGGGAPRTAKLPRFSQDYVSAQSLAIGKSAEPSSQSPPPTVLPSSQDHPSSGPSQPLSQPMIRETLDREAKQKDWKGDWLGHCPTATSIRSFELATPGAVPSWISRLLLLQTGKPSVPNVVSIHPLHRGVQVR